MAPYIAPIWHIYIYIYISMSDSVLSTSSNPDVQAFFKLRKRVKDEDLSIVKFDKGDGLAVMNRLDYLAQMESFLREAGAAVIKFSIESYNSAIRYAISTSSYLRLDPDLQTSQQRIITLSPSTYTPRHHYWKTYTSSQHYAQSLNLPDCPQSIHLTFSKHGSRQEGQPEKWHAQSACTRRPRRSDE
jgi:hypothetical protein